MAGGHVQQDFEPRRYSFLGGRQSAEGAVIGLRPSKTCCARATQGPSGEEPSPSVDRPTPGPRPSCRPRVPRLRSDGLERFHLTSSIGAPDIPHAPFLRQVALMPSLQRLSHRGRSTYPAGVNAAGLGDAVNPVDWIPSDALFKRWICVELESLDVAAQGFGRPSSHCQ